LAGICVALIALAGPYRPHLTGLPADWTEEPGITVSVYPSGAVYEGEWISVVAAMDSDPRGWKLQLRLDRADDAPLAESDFYFNSATLQWDARLAWVWNSAGGDGWHTLFFTLDGDPAGTAPAPLHYPVRVLPAAERPVLRRNAGWQQAEEPCCTLFYLSGTEAQRDIAELQAMTEAIFDSMDAKIGGGAPIKGAQTEEEGAQTKLTLVFLPRVYGQGGLVMQEGYISYADRNYTGTDFRVVLEHEMNHLIMNARSGSGPRAPLLLLEGWAVHLTGGHYRVPESLTERAAALLALGNYTPLSELAESFSAAQHEAAYIEAGAFMEYLAGRFGHARVAAMLFDPVDGESPSAAIDAMLRAHCGCALAECEADWLAALHSLTPGADTVRDVEFYMDLFDLIREYQQAYTAGTSMHNLFLPDPARARAEQITADYLPPPEPADAAALELMFVAAREAADGGEWTLARELLAAIGRVLEAKARRAPDPASESALAERYRDLAAAVFHDGGEPLRIAMQGDEAAVSARDPVTLAKEEQRWIFVHGSWAPGG
jgi:hypothetical protein